MWFGKFARSSSMVRLRNEFATVEVGRVTSASGEKLRIVDVASGADIYLDPIELESLTKMRHETFASFLDPSNIVIIGEPDPDEV